ncbi:MAG TPA: DMT family transporter [Gemmatimonadota bacterium]|nr:DMT family transporter [Gemmatimonadota bacterium]
MTEEQKGTLAVLASATGYGFLAVLLKLALEAGAAVAPLAAWRFVLAAAMTWGFLALSRRPLPPRSAWGPLAGLGAIYAVNALAFVAALRWIPASTATLVFYGYPVVVVVLAGFLLGERFTRHKLAGTALAVVGCVVTAGVGARSGHPAGVLLVLLAMTSLSVYIVTGRRLLGRLPARGSATVIVTATAVVLVAAAAATGDLALGGGGRAVALVALIALVSTALPMTLFVVGLQRVGAGRAAVYSTIEPVVTVAAAWILLGERIAVWQYAGGALVLAGVLWLRVERPLPESEVPTPLDAP